MSFRAKAALIVLAVLVATSAFASAKEDALKLASGHGQGELALKASQAKKFAAAVAADQGAKLDRYTFALAQASPEERAGNFEYLLELGKWLSTLTDERYAVFKEAFQYTFSEKNIELGKAVAISEMASNFGDTGKRYQKALSYFENDGAAGVDAALTLYSRAGGLPDKEYDAYAKAFDFAYQNKELDFDRAIEFADKSKDLAAKDAETFQRNVDRALKPVDAGGLGLKPATAIRRAERAMQENDDSSLSLAVPGEDDDGTGCWNWDSVPHPKVSGFDDALAAINDQASRGGFKYPRFVPEKTRVEIQIASEAFSFPERYLACVYQAESGFRPNLTSSTGAKNISQLMQGTISSIMQDLRKPIAALTGAAANLRARWDYFWKAAGTASRTPAKSITRTDFERDITTGIAGGAYWSRKYASLTFPGKDPKSFSDDDLLLVSGSYHMGPGTLGGRAGLLGSCPNLKAGAAACIQTLFRTGHPATAKYMTAIGSCMKKGG